MRTYTKAEKHVLKTILNLNLIDRMRRAGALALLSLSLCAIAIVTAVTISRAQTAAPAAPKLAPALPPDPARDAATKVYLQKHFKIPDPDMIMLGPVVKTPIPSLYGRQVVITFGVGQKATSALFFDRNGTKMIIGTYIDTSAEPWGRVNLSGIHLADNATMGPADAPVTIVEFADFECPFCARAFSIVETLVNTTYKNKVKVIFKHYPLAQHLWAGKAAAAAECARMQNPNAFWDFARYFYSNQGSITPKNLQENVDKEATKLKLDAPSLKVCMDSPQTSDRVKQDQADGNSVKVSSTPTFFVDGIPLVGLPDNKVLEFTIKSELEERSASAKH
jgi:protein-disulfide isomerase